MMNGSLTVPKIEIAKLHKIICTAHDIVQPKKDLRDLRYHKFIVYFITYRGKVPQLGAIVDNRTFVDKGTLVDGSTFVDNGMLVNER